jgi:hypothetical protein
MNSVVVITSQFLQEDINIKNPVMTTKVTRSRGLNVPTRVQINKAGARACVLPKITLILFFFCCSKVTNDQTEKLDCTQDLASQRKQAQ